METTPILGTPPSSFTLKRLLRRAWTILFKEPWGKGRISRGEMLIASMVLGVIVMVITVPLSWISGSIASIVSGISGLWSFGYMFRRAHDLGKPIKYVLLPIIGLVIVNVVAFGIAMFVLGINMHISFSSMNPLSFLSSLSQNNTVIVLLVVCIVVIFLLCFVRYIIVLLNLLFKKGTVGDNQYGSDPLLTQPTTNGLYRRAALLLSCLFLIISGFAKPDSSYEYESYDDFDWQAELPADQQADMQDAVDQAIADEEQGEYGAGRMFR